MVRDRNQTDLVRNDELVCEIEKIVADDDGQSGGCGSGCAVECGKCGVPGLIGSEMDVSAVLEPGEIGSGWSCGAVVRGTGGLGVCHKTGGGGGVGGVEACGTKVSGRSGWKGGVGDWCACNARRPRGCFMRFIRTVVRKDTASGTLEIADRVVHLDRPDSANPQGPYSNSRPAHQYRRSQDSRRCRHCNSCRKQYKDCWTLDGLC